MAFWTSPRYGCLCWIEAIYDITDSFHCSFSYRNAGCSLSKAGAENFYLEGQEVEKEKQQRRRLSITTRKITQGMFLQQKHQSHTPVLFRAYPRYLKWWCPLGSFCKSEFWKLSDAEGIPEVLDMAMEGWHVSRDESHLPGLCSTCVKLVNSLGLILALEFIHVPLQNSRSCAC